MMAKYGPGWNYSTVYQTQSDDNAYAIALESSGEAASSWRLTKVVAWSERRIKADDLVVANKMLHVCGTCDSLGVLSLYINGVKQTQTDISLGTVVGAASKSVYRNTRSVNTSFQFKGLTADFCIHNRALSPAEIALLADRTDPMLGGLIVEERPVLWFDMGGSTTDELIATDLVTSSPVLGTPALSQVHALTVTGLATSAPVIGSPALGQVHGLAATALTVLAPVLGSPAVGQIHSPDCHRAGRWVACTRHASTV